jgi:hypothetical protein
MTFKTLALAAATASLFAVPAVAHHSFAMFDNTKTMTLAGTVKEYEWINPHVWVHITVPDQAGKPVDWSFEAGSTGQVAATGWKADTIKPGDKIEMTFHPMRDGSHGGQVLAIKLASGQSLCQGGYCRRQQQGGGAPAAGGAD